MPKTTADNKDSPATVQPKDLEIFYARLAGQTFIIGCLSSFGILHQAPLLNLIGYLSVFITLDFISLAINNHYKENKNEKPLGFDTAFSSTQLYQSKLLLLAGFGEASLSLHRRWLPTWLYTLLFLFGLITLVCGQSFRFLQQVEGHLQSPNVSRAFKTLRPQFNGFPMNKISFYAWLLALQLVVGNLLTFGIVMFQCKNEMDRSTSRGKPDAAVRYTEGRHDGGLWGLPLLDGAHSIQNISLHAFFIGLIGGTGISFYLSGRSYYTFGFYLIALSNFHILEYITTALYRKDVSLIAFLLNHSREYHIAVLASIFEYWIEYLIFPSLKQISFLFYIGLVGTLFSQIIRSLAMLTAQSNFTHLVSYEKEASHRLVTWGIYRYLRHPSYTGFFYWGIFAQLALANPFCFIAYAFVLQKFFVARIQDEEESLINFFGQEYEEYRKKTPVLIPGIL